MLYFVSLLHLWTAEGLQEFSMMPLDLFSNQMIDVKTFKAKECSQARLSMSPLLTLILLTMNKISIFFH